MTLLTDGELYRSVNSFNANNKQNGGTTQTNPSDPTFLSAVQDSGIQAPGVVNIPVCSAEEATNNWNVVSNGGKKSKHYPCN